MWEKAKVRFPRASIFRDAEQHFELSHLLGEANDSDNVLVVLSPHHLHSAYTMWTCATPCAPG